MPVRNLAYLFHELLKDVYYLENRLLRNLPKMISGVRSAELAAILQKRRLQTESHVKRLENVFAMLGKRPEAGPWPVAAGMIDEALDLVAHCSSPAIDAGLLASAQVVTQYEITRYTTLQCWAAMLGLNDAARLLDATRQEKVLSNQDLHALADEMFKTKRPAKTFPVEVVPTADLISLVA
jgi:ferritin-like metal-binding protein YciE